MDATGNTTMTLRIKETKIQTLNKLKLTYINYMQMSQDPSNIATKENYVIRHSKYRRA